LASKRDRTPDLVITGAPAQSARDRFTYFVAARPASTIFVQEGFSRQDHAGNAISALDGAAFDERSLQRMQMLRISDSLDGCHRASRGLGGQQDAGIHRLA